MRAFLIPTVIVGVLAVTGSDELTELSRVFNRMLGDMQQSRARIEYLFGKLEELAHASGATKVWRAPTGALVTYEGLFRGFKADLALDADGLVMDYPETFRRLAPR